ncbi:MAG: hypothetical protein ACLF0P_06465 [Thermoanaerobaculia bacterium]
MTPSATVAGTDTLTFPVLMDRAMVWTRGHLRSVVLPLAAPLAVFDAAVAAVQVPWLQQLYDPSALAAESGFDSSCAIVLVGFGSAAVSWLVYCAVGAAATDAVAGRPVAAWDRLRFVLRPGPLGTLLLSGVLVGISYLCCVVPVLYVAPLLSLTVPALVEEDRRGLDAVGRSANLIRYNPQRRFLANPLTKAFVLFLVTALISVLVSLVTTAPFQIAQQWSVLRDLGAAEAAAPPEWTLWLQVPGAAVNAFVSTAVVLYATFGFALLFFDVRRRKEGLDLEAAVAELERERSGGREPAGELGPDGPPEEGPR